MLTILLLVFVVLLLVGVPIGLAMLGSAMLVIGIEGIPLSVVAQRVATGVQSFPLLAIPLFTLAGALMNESGISERLFAFTRAFVGHIRGGLAQTAIVGNVFLSGISGSSVADCAATSRVFVPQLVKAGYGRGFAAAVCAAAATLGPIIPPSILMVIYAWQANVSLGDLFIAGADPRRGDGRRDDGGDLLGGAQARIPQGRARSAGRACGRSSAAHSGRWRCRC